MKRWVYKEGAIYLGDCLKVLKSLPENSVDLVLGSPPYMDARTYGIDAVYDCQQWVDWMLQVSEAAVRVSKGLVLWVVAGVQRQGNYWSGCEGLMWEWWRLGRCQWRPCIWWKVDMGGGGTGIPGSGGKQWLRNDWEYVIAFKKSGPLPWADNTVMGHSPVCKRAGGAMSNRRVDGLRTNAQRKKWERDVLPERANPGNCIIVKARVGGGHIGSQIAHDNEAPYPLELASFFVRSFCPPNGTVADPFSGSGTTLAAAVQARRKFIVGDIRESQIKLSQKRLQVARLTKGFDLP